MVSNEKIAVLAEEQARIDAARAAFLAQGGRVQVLQSFEFRPAPARKAWIDPETVLKRKPLRITLEQRRILRQIAAAL
jgi:hypothetical protein